MFAQASPLLLTGAAIVGSMMLLLTAVSNAASQRQFILTPAAERGLRNVQVLTADMNVFAA